MERIILASASPRRQALLKQICIPFEIIESEADENIDDEVSPYDLVKILSMRKAMNVIDKLKKNDNEFLKDLGITIIIAADTIVTFKGQVLGKPKDETDAFNMLKKLQGKHHSVYTGMTIVFKQNENIKFKTIIDNTIVFIRQLSDDDIKKYIKTNEPFDKAGAYAIQEKGSLLVEKIEGDYYTVVGLPLTKLYMALKDFGIDLTDKWF